MKKTIAVAVFGIAALCSVAPAQFTPKWRVGDWWIVKEKSSNLRGGWQWQHWRYDVLRVERIGGRDCFVLQEGGTTSPGEGPRNLYYVRRDNWTIVRQASYLQQAGKLVGPGTIDYPNGMFGPIVFQPRLPWFPLDTTLARDSTFREYVFPHHCAYLRQLSGPADTVLLNLYRGAPDTLGGRAVPLGRGVLYSVLSESGEGRDSILVPGDYSLQLWSTDYPWRLYEEVGQYARDGRRWDRRPSWLIAWGRSEGR